MNNADAAPLYHVWPQKRGERDAVELPALALGKPLVGRTRNLTKRYEDTIHFTRAAGSLS
jgi:hypothetical protein